MLSLFKNVTTDRLDLDELIELSAYGRAFLAEYKTRNVEVPEWATNSMQTIDREITSRRQEAIQAEIKRINAKLSTLKTAAEQRTELQEKLERLQSQTSTVTA